MVSYANLMVYIAQIQVTEKSGEFIDIHWILKGFALIFIFAFEIIETHGWHGPPISLIGHHSLQTQGNMHFTEDTFLPPYCFCFLLLFLLFRMTWTHLCQYILSR